MSSQDIYECVERFISTELKDVPFDKGLPLLRMYVWKLADEVGMTGADVLKIYFDLNTSNKKI